MSAMEEQGRRFYCLCANAAEGLYGLRPKFTVGRPRDPKNGDLASSAALALGGALRRRPSEIAAEIAERIELLPGEKLEVGGKGFLNLYLSADFLRGLLRPVTELPEIKLPNLSDGNFYMAHCYHRLRRLLELHGGGEPAPLEAPEELRLLRAVAWEDPEELAPAAMELYDRLGLNCGPERELLLKNGLRLLWERRISKL